MAGYDGRLTLEAFGAAMPSLVAATRIWRRKFVDEEVLAREGLAFTRRAWAEAARPKENAGGAARAAGVS